MKSGAFHSVGRDDFLLDKKMMGHISISLDKEPLTDGDKKWEALLASDEAQRLLETMADEASKEILAGKV
ncbi:hypothetical protein U14_00662 [Candidatus Moduliflexus flocculans]|uniref:Uncharacterized protein n=1 Tax=Candidatus Moduliflexus flocculans TaxID=1499966 RepID=A0A0S6VQQ8_9BACT|nr:hypothetical protein U14_00662 [Candidatus Moduliflexus flocculans]